MSLAVGHGVGAGWSGFWEVFGTMPADRDGGAAWIFDTGASRIVARQWQVDVSIGRGLTTEAPDWFVGTGLAVRRSPHRWRQ